MTSRIERGVVALALAAAALALYWRCLLVGGSAIPWDLPDYHRPLFTTIVRALGEGRIPLWDPFVYCGFPFFANLQAQLFYPAAWPFFALGTVVGAGHYRDLLEWQVALHCLMAGVFTYRLGRRMGLGRSAALMAGLAFETSGFFVSQSQHVGAISAAAWMPLAWSAVVELAAGKRFGVRVAMLGGALAMSFLAGFPGVTTIVYGFTGLLAVLLWRPVAGFAVAAGLSLALAGVQLLPTVELSGLSNSALRGTFTDDAGGVPWQGLVSIVAPRMFHPLEPELYKQAWNPTFMYLYAGFLLPLLAAGALGLKGAWRWRMPVMALAAGVWMMGGHTPVGLWGWRALPVGFRSSLYQEFAMTALLLALAVMAGLGFERWLSGRAGWQIAVLLALMVADPVARGSRSWFLDSDAGDPAPIDERQFESNHEVVAALRELGGRFEAVKANVRFVGHAGEMKLATASGSDPLALAAYERVRRQYAPGPLWERTPEVSVMGSKAMDELSVRAIVSKEKLDYPVAARAGEYVVYENLRAMPRYRMKGGRVRIVRETAERVELAVEGAGRIESSDVNYPGWRVFVDGREGQVLTVGGAFRGVDVESGARQVVFRFEPAVLSYGAGLSLAGLAAAVWLWRKAI